MPQSKRLRSCLLLSNGSNRSPSLTCDLAVSLRGLAERRVGATRLAEHGEQGSAVALGEFAGPDAAERLVGGEFERAVDEARDGHSPQGRGPLDLGLKRLGLADG